MGFELVRVHLGIPVLPFARRIAIDGDTKTLLFLLDITQIGGALPLSEVSQRVPVQQYFFSLMW